MLSHFPSQVQVYWSESPKAKFVKQGEVNQVKIIWITFTFTDNDHFCFLPQVSFTAKLTVSDKKVKWSFQDQVSITIHPNQDQN